MAHAQRPTSPELLRAQGMSWLLRYFHGETITGIAKSDNTYRRKVRTLMKTAAATLIDAAQQTLLADTFPRMVKLLNAAIDQQLKAADEGKAIDTALVERMMRGLYITEAPQLKTELVREAGGDAEGEELTLSGFVAKRVLTPPRPTPTLPASNVIVDAETVTDGNPS
jgi:P2-related tail formation protein